jgi:hypothetical protein
MRICVLAIVSLASGRIVADTYLLALREMAGHPAALRASVADRQTEIPRGFN